MFFWNEERIRFMCDAAVYPALHERLARELLPMLEGDTVCDAGCGIGQLSFALSPHLGAITAVDSDEAALSVLREAALPNVRTVCADVFSLPENLRFDSMIFCFFGSASECLRLAKAHGAKTAILIKKDTSLHRFGRGELENGSSYARALSELNARGIAYEATVIDADMGQPFRSLSDAVRFFALYGSPVSEEAAASRLEPCPLPQFPLYLPAPCRIGLIRIELLKKQKPSGEGF